MIRCKEVAKLLLSDLIPFQSRMKRLGISFHLAICKHCSRLARQIKLLRRAARKMDDAVEAERSAPAEDNLEARLLHRLSENRQ